MGSGLIYAVIIVMWGAYFIPLWLRRQEERSEARSADRFSHAMRILSRRNPTLSGDQQNMVPGPLPAETPRPRRQPVGPGSATPRARAAKPSKRTFRRRRILLGLLLVTLVLAGLTPVTPVTWPMPLAAFCATVVYVLHLRLQARRERALTRTRQSIRRRAMARLRRLDAADRIFQARSALRTEGVEAEPAQAMVAESAHGATAGDSSGWEPVPVPLPTYVTKPVAPRPSSASPAAEADQQPFDQVAAAQPSAAQHKELDEVVEQRRAVND